MFARRIFSLLGLLLLVASLASSATAANGGTPVRHGFLGAFFRAEGAPPFGVFSAAAKAVAPEPYPAPRSKLFGPGGYCDAVAKNGVSIATGHPVDPSKVQDIVDLGVKWTRTGIAAFTGDQSHVFGPGRYAFGDMDAAQCALLRHNISPVIALGAGPVMVNEKPGSFSPHAVPMYETPADFGTWCSVVAKHEAAAFPAVTRYTLPGNEVNSDQRFTGGEAQIAAYAEACYRAIHAVKPTAFVYGLELNMDGHLNAARFVQRLYDLGCKVGTCYDGLSLHLSLRYPIPPPGTPCYPNPGGDYSMQCIVDVQHAAHAPVHVLIGETVYTVPGSVPTEAAKADAIVAEMKAFAADGDIDGVNYANIDECGLYPSGIFAHGCIIDTAGSPLPGYAALKALAAGFF